jgi:alpha-L-fucosidase
LFNTKQQCLQGRCDYNVQWGKVYAYKRLGNVAAPETESLFSRVSSISGLWRKMGYLAHWRKVIVGRSPILVVALISASLAVPDHLTLTSALQSNPILPSNLQVKLLNFDMTAFVHFSITTYTGSQGGNQNASSFAPDPATLNVSQWVSTVKAMGAKVAVLTSKHEAGFCLWPTNTSSRNFSIAMSPTVGRRDLIQEFTEECRKQDVLPGLYFGAPDPYTVEVLGLPQGSAGHEAVQLAQMRELTTRYGDLHYIWFDHYCQHPGKLHPEWICPMNHTFAALADIVRQNQPSAVVSGQDTKSIGAEFGYAPYPLYYQCDTRTGQNTSNCLDSQGGHDHDGHNNGTNGVPAGRVFKAPESDCSIYSGCHPWFASDSAPVQTVAAAIQHWELVVGRGSEYILNVPPSKTGRIASREAKAAAALGAEVKRRYGCGHGRSCSPLARASFVVEEGASFVMVIPGGSTSNGAPGTSSGSSIDSDSNINSPGGSFNRAWLAEAVQVDGQRVQAYRLESKTADQKWVFLNSSFNYMSSGYR